MKGTIFCVVIVVLIGYLASITINLLDLTKKTALHNTKNCSKTPIDMPSEDLVTFGKYIIGATGDGPNLYYRHLSASKAAPGYLIVINPETKEVSKLKTNGFPSHFQMNAHGITLFNQKTLYVLSHSYKKGGEIVFLFDLKESSEGIEADYVKSIKIDDDYCNYNGIAVVDENHFYITQWIPFPDTEEGRDLSFFINLKRVLLFSFTKTSGVKLCVVEGDKSKCEMKTRGYIPNGIVAHGNMLFYADSIGKSVEVLEIQTNYDLKHIQSVPISHVVDNLRYENGSVYVTGVSLMIDYIKFTETAKNNEPWHFVPDGVSKLDKIGNKWESKEIAMQDIISLPSSTIILGKQIVFSSIIDNTILFCELEN